MCDKCFFFQLIKCNKHDYETILHDRNNINRVSLSVHFFFTEGIEPGLTSKNEINPKDYFSPY